MKSELAAASLLLNEELGRIIERHASARTSADRQTAEEQLARFLMKLALVFCYDTPSELKSYAGDVKQEFVQKAMRRVTRGLTNGNLNIAYLRMVMHSVTVDILRRVNADPATISIEDDRPVFFPAHILDIATLNNGIYALTSDSIPPRPHNFADPLRNGRVSLNHLLCEKLVHILPAPGNWTPR